MAPVPGDEVNVRLGPIYCKALVCSIGTRDKCEAQQEKTDRRMIKKKTMKKIPSFFQDSTSEMAAWVSKTLKLLGFFSLFAG